MGYNMDESFLVKIIVGLMAIITGILGFNLRSYKAGHDALKDSHGKLALHISEDYAKKSDLNAARQEVKEGLERVHERIDTLGDTVERKMDTVIGMLKK